MICHKMNSEVRHHPVVAHPTLCDVLAAPCPPHLCENLVKSSYIPSTSIHMILVEPPRAPRHSSAKVTMKAAIHDWMNETAQLYIVSSTLWQGGSNAGLRAAAAADASAIRCPSAHGFLACGPSCASCAAAQTRSGLHRPWLGPLQASRTSRRLA